MTASSQWPGPVGCRRQLCSERAGVLCGRFTVGAPHRVHHTGCITQCASHRVHHTGCITQCASHSVHHTVCVTQGASHMGSFKGVGAKVLTERRYASTPIELLCVKHPVRSSLQSAAVFQRLCLFHTECVTRFVLSCPGTHLLLSFSACCAH